MAGRLSITFVALLALACLAAGDDFADKFLEDDTDVSTEATSAQSSTSDDPSPTTTSPAPEPTTTPTEEPTTSTAAPTTDAPTTTTEVPVTTDAPTTVAPKETVYNISADGVPCVMLAATIRFDVGIIQADNTTKTIAVAVPSPADGGVASGDCKDPAQKLTVTWEATNSTSSVAMTFNSTGAQWKVLSVEASLNLGEGFENSTSHGKVLLLDPISLEGVEGVAVNQSFSCMAEIKAAFTNATVDADAYVQPVALSIKELQLEAYNAVPGENFVQAVHCHADAVSDIVPIAVGCALAGLVVIVLVVYLVNRRRRTRLYQSV